MSVCLSVSLSVSLSVCQSVSQPASGSVCLPVCLSVCPLETFTFNASCKLSAKNFVQTRTRLRLCNDNRDIISVTLQYFPVHGVPVEIYTGEIREKQGLF